MRQKAAASDQSKSRREIKKEKRTKLYNGALFPPVTPSAIQLVTVPISSDDSYNYLHTHTVVPALARPPRMDPACQSAAYPGSPSEAKVLCYSLSDPSLPSVPVFRVPFMAEV